MTTQRPDHTEARENELNAIREDYNRIPYQSFPYPKSSPAHMRTIGKLFCMNMPALETARILELGCAAGGNIIPLAVHYPQAHFVGVDLSDVQISSGKDFISHLGLQNIELKAGSITDIDKTFGKFDYIIAHGVFSWVPDFVREHILKICQELLTPSGIAYISYNTLPGWNTRRIIRDMAMYHGKNFGETGEKIRQTKELLSFISQALEGADDSYTRLIMESVNFLKDRQDFYIAHDFLETNNKAFYFSDFNDMASRYELKFLAEASLPEMYLGNYSDAVNDTLSQINDIIKTEQYLDFITNRHFRATLLCRQNQDDVVERTLRKDSLYACFLRTCIVPARHLDQVDLNDTSQELEFDIGAGQTDMLTTNSPELKAVLYAFAGYFNTFVSFDEVIERAVEKMPKASRQTVINEVDGSLLALYLSGRMDIRSDAVPVNHQPSDKPKVWSYAAAQCTYLPVSYVTNLYHEPVAISIFEKFMIPLLDGTRTKQDVLAQMMQHAMKNDFDVNFEGKKVETEERIINILSLAIIDGIEKFSKSGLLVNP